MKNFFKKNKETKKEENAKNQIFQKKDNIPNHFQTGKISFNNIYFLFLI